MAITLSSSRHSFVQVTSDERDTGCVPDINICLPVYSPTFDISFQVTAYVDGTDKDNFQLQTDIVFPDAINTVQAKICRQCVSDESFSGERMMQFDSSWTKIVSDPIGSDVWVGNFHALGGTNMDIWDDMQPGDCFHLCFHQCAVPVANHLTLNEYDSDVIACTNCFQKVADECFTSRFTYSNNENSFGFYYDVNGDGVADFANTVRLPCYLRDMQLPSEEKSYQKSDGTFIKLYERINEDYELNIDWMPKTWHQKLKVLLAHDHINIRDFNELLSTVNITCAEKYQIQWPEHPWQHAPAKTRVTRTEPLHLLNSNCQ
jgi:hypothetical protein